MPTVEGLGLETAGVKFDTKNGIIANSKLQTSVKHIYAAGEAQVEGNENALKGNRALDC